MRLKLLTPTGVVVDEAATKIVAEAVDGYFCLLPRHVDFVSALVPGLFTYWDAGGAERLLATDEGTLVKCGREVMVSVRDAVPGDDLASLRDTVEREFLRLSDRERQARSALARLEAGAIRRAGGLGGEPVG